MDEATKLCMRTRKYTDARRLGSFSWDETGSASPRWRRRVVLVLAQGSYRGWHSFRNHALGSASQGFEPQLSRRSGEI
jgi:hypothetical protein